MHRVVSYLLRVIDEEHAEEQGNEGAVHGVEERIAIDGNYDGDDAEEKQDPTGSKKINPPAWKERNST